MIVTSDEVRAIDAEYKQALKTLGRRNPPSIGERMVEKGLWIVVEKK